MAHVVGIDLGTHSVKLSLLDGGFRKHVVLGHQIREIPQDGTSIPDLSARLAILAELLSEHQLDPNVESALAFPSELASFRTVTLPFTDHAQVAKTLPFEIENHVPYDLDEMTLDYQLVSTGLAESRILAGLAEQSRVRDLIEQLKDVGIDPRNMPFDADVLSVYGTSGNQAVIDIGHSRTLVSLLHDGVTFAVRALDGGGRDLTLRLCSAFNLDYATAEACKHAIRIRPEQSPALAVPVSGEWVDEDHTQPIMDLPGLGPDHPPLDLQAMARVIEEGLAELASNIRSTLISFEDLLQLEVDEILLTGGTSALDGIFSWLSEDLGLPVRGVMVEAPEDPVVTGGIPSQYALSYALALRATSDAPQRFLEVRRGAFQYRGKVRTFQNALLLGAAAWFLLLFSGAGVFAWKHHELSRSVHASEEQIRGAVTGTFPDVEPSRLKDVSTAVAIMQERTLELTSRVDALGSAMLGQPPMLSLLKDLSNAMPPHEEARIDIKDLVLSEEAVSFSAETDGYETAAKIESALQKTPQFKKAAKGEEKKQGESVVFSVSIPLGEDSEEEDDTMEARTASGEPSAGGGSGKSKTKATSEASEKAAEPRNGKDKEGNP